MSNSTFTAYLGIRLRASLKIASNTPLRFSVGLENSDIGQTPEWFRDSRARVYLPRSILLITPWIPRNREQASLSSYLTPPVVSFSPAYHFFTYSTFLLPTKLGHQQSTIYYYATNRVKEACPSTTLALAWLSLHSSSAALSQLAKFPPCNHRSS